MDGFQLDVTNIGVFMVTSVVTDSSNVNVIRILKKKPYEIKVHNQ